LLGIWCAAVGQTEIETGVALLRIIVAAQRTHFGL
jgi:hypothetical protein